MYFWIKFIFQAQCGDAVYVHLTKTPPRLRWSLIAISSSLLAWWEIDTEYKMKIKNKERKKERKKDSCCTTNSSMVSDTSSQLITLVHWQPDWSTFVKISSCEITWSMYLCYFKPQEAYFLAARRRPRQL